MKKLVIICSSILLFIGCNKKENLDYQSKEKSVQDLTTVEYLNASGIPSFEITAVAQDVNWAHKKAEAIARTLLDRAIEGRMEQILSPCPKPYELKFNSDYKIHWLEEKVELKGEVEAYFHGSVALSPFFLDTLLGQVAEQSSEFNSCVQTWRKGEFILQKNLWNAL
jgi:hypothetical protein